MSLEANIGDLPVVEPRDVVARPDVHVARVDLRIDIAHDRLRLRDLLRLQATALEHVLEVHVAADIQLVGAVEDQSALLEESREHPVGDGRPELALDVVPDDGHPRGGELRGPFRVARDEHREGVDEGDTRIDGRLGVVLRGEFRPDGEVADEHVDAGVAQRLGHIDGRSG